MSEEIKQEVEVETPTKTEPVVDDKTTATEPTKLYKSFKTEEDWNDYLNGVVTERVSKEVLKKLDATSVEEIKEKYGTAIEGKLNAEKKAEELEKKLNTIQTNLTLNKFNIPEENRADVLALAKIKVDKDTNLEQAIKKVTEAYPSFATTKVNTGVDKTDAKNISKETKDNETAKLRQLAGLK